MQQNRSRVVWFVIIAIGFLVIVDPFRWFEGDAIPRTLRVNSDVRQEMESFLARSPTAEQFVVDALEEHDLVLIGETGFVREQALYLTRLIPRLDEAGVRHLGLVHASLEDQSLIDELLTASSFDERLAHQILFNFQVIYGYQEYVEVFRSAWQVNRDREQGEQPFRIVGVGFTPDYSVIETEEDINDPEVLRQVFRNGIPDEEIAGVISEQLVEPGYRAAVYLQFPQAFTGFEQPLYRQNMEEQGFPNQKRAGNILRDRYGTRVISAIFHTPVRESRSRTGYGYPIGGVLDDIIATLPEGEHARGFFVADSPFSDAPISSDSLAQGLEEEELTFQRFTDAYLTLGPIASYTAVTPIPDFIDESNLATALQEFPGPNPGDISVSEMNEYIAANAGQMTRILEQFE